MGIDSRAVALAVLSVVAAVVQGFAVGVRAGALAGVLAALAGFLPAVVWELTRDLRERNARVAGRRKAALKAFVPAVAPPAAGGPVAGSPGERRAAWYLRPEAQVGGVPAAAGTEPVAGVVRGQGGARFVGGSMTFVCAEFAGSEVNFTNAHFTGETLINAGTAGLHAR